MSISLDLSIFVHERAGSGVEVRVQVPPKTTAAELTPLLSRMFGMSDCALSVGGTPLAEQTVVGMPPLLTGAAVQVHERAPSQHPSDKQRPRPDTSSAVDLVICAGPDAGQRIPLPSTGALVGRANTCDLSVNDPAVSREHLWIEPVPDGFAVCELANTNGTTYRGDPLDVATPATVPLGARLRMGGSSFLRIERAGVLNAPHHPAGDATITVNRQPRTRVPSEAVTITGPARPTEPHRTRLPWITALVPIPFAIALALMFSPQFLMFAALSPIMLVATAIGDRIGARRQYRRDLAVYEQLLGERRRELALISEQEVGRRWRDLPDPATIAAIASGPAARLWERRPHHDDFGTVRIGLGQFAGTTAWREDPAATARPEMLPDNPVAIDIASAGVVGIAGDTHRLDAALRSVIGQLLTLHSPEDLHLVLIDPYHDARWRWTQRSAHSRPTAATACIDQLHEIVALIDERAGSDDQAGHRQARLVVVIPSYAAAADQECAQLLADAMARGPAAGVWFVIGENDPTALPPACRAVASLGTQPRLDVDGAATISGWVADGVGWWWSERIGRALAPLRPAGRSTAQLPDEIDLLTILPESVGPPGTLDPDLLAKWWQRPTHPPSCTIGVTAEGPLIIDLATDGPHLLIGGTTGSGKSELLRTMVTSLAVEHSPHDLCFILIDYKGGAAFGEIADLPHTVGMVTNLDEHLAERALISLRAEITRRERLLAAAAAKDLDEFRARGGQLGRLVLIVDEFRILAEEIPEFVSGIVDIASVGRSLGIHLVLATQRPGGAVTADIKANVNLRIAMRVRDPIDSMDVIDCPEAARIPPTTPGRGLARTADGQLLSFQSARVGNPGERVPQRVVQLLADPDGRAVSSRVAEMAPTPTTAARSELSEIVAVIAEAAGRAGIQQPHRPWLPPLPESLDVGPIDMDHAPLPVALVDYPQHQRQEWLQHDPLDRLWLIAGGPRSGRSTFIRAVALSVIAADPTTQVYAVSSAPSMIELESLPQVGAVIPLSAASRIRRMLAIATARASSVSATGPTMLLVDGWPSAHLQVNPGAHELLTDLEEVMIGTTAPALRGVIAGDRSLLTSRLSSAAAQLFVLPLADRTEAMAAGLSSRDLPHTWSPGCAVRVSDRAKLQVVRYRNLDTLTSADRSRATPVVELPRFIDADRLAIDAEERLSQTTSPAGSERGIPYGLTELGEIATWDPSRDGRRLLVTGAPGTGRTNAVETFARAASRAGHPVAVIERSGQIAARIARAGGVCVAGDYWDAITLTEALRAHPDLWVLIDDAEQLEGTALEPVILDLLRVLDRDGAVVLAATTSQHAGAAFRGVLPMIARGQSGLVLCPQSSVDGAPFGIQIPRGTPSHPGRAVAIRGRRCTEVHIAAHRANTHSTVTEHEPAFAR